MEAINEARELSADRRVKVPFDKKFWNVVDMFNRVTTLFALFYIAFAILNGWFMYMIY